MEAADGKVNIALLKQSGSTTGHPVVYSKLDYCNSLYYNLLNSELKRLQHSQNSLAQCVVVKAPKFAHAIHYSQISSVTYNIKKEFNINFCPLLTKFSPLPSQLLASVT